MSEQMRYDDRVAIITGAGLGRIYALLFASRGAKVVVNDLGGSRDGSGNSTRAADKVVEEIRRAGGTAVANYDSVEDAYKVVATAIQNFGRVDILINNAGILRDKSFAKLTDQDWDLVLRVHLRGSYKMTRACWPIFREQNYGRILMTGSGAGLYGNYGQSNYASAKLALVALSNTVAKEGKKHNILCNAIAPIAASRLTEDLFPPKILAAVKPEFVAPLVAVLCHEGSKENGGIFELGAGQFYKVRYERSEGVLFKADASFVPGAIAAQWKKIIDFSRPQHPTSASETDWISLCEKAKTLAANPTGPDMRYDGQVALVTGAGNGLGRAYALLLSRLGAAVVVNDLGKFKDGSGKDMRAADVVVAEIVKAGGKAVANYDSVEFGDRIVDQAIKAFGRVDILVNNAGILRDRSLVKMTDEDWDLVYAVHLKGTYKVTKAAWPHMLKQKYGRIINTASAVGLYGNFGQSNYSACKLGIHGLTQTLAIEGVKYNIKVNTVAPNAGTAMTATVLTPELVEVLKPDYVAPLVAFLAHEDVPESGGLYETGSCWISKVRWQRSKGAGLPVLGEITPEQVAAVFPQICDFTQHTYPRSLKESVDLMYKGFQASSALVSAQTASTGANPMEAARKYRTAEVNFDYTEKDVILYALGLGARRTDLDLVYENSERFFTLPTFAVLPFFALSFDFGQFLPEFNPMMLLHGEQYLQLHAPLPTSGSLKAQGRIIEMVDKGKSAVVVLGVDIKGQDGGLLAQTQLWGPLQRPGPRLRHRHQLSPEGKEPDVVETVTTSADQAALYRLCGDYNPLHIDPSMSQLGGFDVPILHGLCTYGIAAKAALERFGGNDPGAIKSVKARFSSHVLPGDRLEIPMWIDPTDARKVILQLRVVSRSPPPWPFPMLPLNSAIPSSFSRAVTKARGPNFSVAGLHPTLRVAMPGSDL
ncbi:hypothetical protein L0F63_002902 [Massospora cicadina]|nr:hypothetical protein L0F63_002902 [Massospora cicadina]